jgi:hypothetical protein
MTSPQTCIELGPLIIANLPSLPFFGETLGQIRHSQMVVQVNPGITHPPQRAINIEYGKFQSRFGH